MNNSIEKQDYEESQLFQLKNGQYLLDIEQSRIFSTIITEHPFYNVDYKWDEMAMGDLFAKCYKHNTLYCPESKQWYSYNGKVWIKDVGAIFTSERLKEFTRLMQLYCNEIPDDSDSDMVKNYKKFIAKLGDRRVRDRILKDAQGEARVSITQFDANPYLINCENGTYDLKSRSFHFHQAEDYLTMKTTCNYLLPTVITEFTRWNDFITEITCSDKEIAEYLQTALGYSLLGRANEECMFIAYGKTTRNGKGTLLNTIHNILGDYAKTISVDFICQNKSGKSTYSSANPMLCELKGARFVTMSESDDSGRLDESVIKNYTGSDPISTRQLYGEAFSFIPQFKMWLSCNTLPTVNDKSLFSSDRIKIIEFKKHFGEKERDTRLKEKFLESNAKSVIFKWLLEGYDKYLNNGLKEPKVIKEAVKQYEKRNDRVGLFVDEMCELDSEAIIGRTELYSSYKTWCKTNGINPKSAQKFYDEIEIYATQKTTRGYRFFQGIKIKNVSPISIK